MANVKPISVEEAPELKGKKVLVRVDFNVPLDNNLRVTDDFKLRAALPTIKYLIQHEAKVILASHLEPPRGHTHIPGDITMRSSLWLILPSLQKLIGPGVSVGMSDKCIGDEVKRLVDALPNGGVLLLENLNYHIEERMNNPFFAKKLASLADIYVSDTFRFPDYASTNGITRHLPYMAGFHRQKVFPLSPGIKKIHHEVADFTDLPPDADEIPEDYVFDGNLDCSLLTSTYSREVLARQCCRKIYCSFPGAEPNSHGVYDVHTDASFRGEESSKGARAGLGGLGRDRNGSCVAYLEGFSDREIDIKFHETEALLEGVDMMAQVGGVHTLRANTDSIEVYEELKNILDSGFSPREQALLRNSEAAEASNEDDGQGYKPVKKKVRHQANLHLKTKAKIVKLRDTYWPGERFRLRLVPREGNYSADSLSRARKSVGVDKVLLQPGQWPPSCRYFCRRDLRTVVHQNQRYLKFWGPYTFLLSKKQQMAKAAGFRF